MSSGVAVLTVIPLVASALSTTTTSAPTALTNQSWSNFCPCSNDQNITLGNVCSRLLSSIDSRKQKLAENAQHMQEAVKNKTWISRVRHRATHSRDAFEASVAVFGLAFLILAGVYSTKMWRDKTHLAIMQKQPVHFDNHSEKTNILVKDMLRSRARRFVELFGRHSTRRPVRIANAPKRNLNMQTFISGGNLNAKADAADGVDQDLSLHRQILFSSSSSSSLESLGNGDSDLDLDFHHERDREDDTFHMDEFTGEWIRRNRRKENHFQGISKFFQTQKIKSFFTPKKKRSTSIMVDASLHLLSEENSESEEEERDDDESRPAFGC